MPFPNASRPKDTTHNSVSLAPQYPKETGSMAGVGVRIRRVNAQPDPASRVKQIVPITTASARISHFHFDMNSVTLKILPPQN
jgi:hypothetical protein